jgi:hypothetical protein
VRSRCVTVTARAWVEDHARALRLTYLGGLCGAVFIVFKAHAWPTEVAQGHTISSNNDFIFYYMLTGVHLFHVLLGLLILGVVARELRNPRRRRMFMVESGPTYWHMVTCSGSSSSHGHLRVDHPVREHYWLVLVGTGSCSRCRGRRQRTNHRGGDPFGIHQGTHDHSILHGSAHRGSSSYFTAGWLNVLWAGILAIYSHQGELN